MTTYQHTTFAQAKARLASLLGDPGMVFWTDTELGTYITEALHWWGLTAMYWKESGKMTVTTGQAFYDVRDITDIGGDPITDTDVTDRDLINEMCYQLIEPPIVTWGSGWIGSEMFSLEEIADILSKSRDDVLRTSGAIATEQTYTVNPGVARVDLDEDTVHILRCSIEEVSSSATQPLPLWAIDYWQAQGYLDTAGAWPTGRPKSFLTNYTPTLAVDLFPDPAVDATLRAYSIESGAEFDPTNFPQFMGLPNDACWIAKYRTLEDLLSGDGLARAPQMAEYCNKRYLEGLETMGTYQSLLWATLDGKRMTISPLGLLDAQRANWQSITGRPRSIHQLNWNLYAVHPVPDNTYDLEIEVVRKAIIPTADGDFIQVGSEQMQAIYDYAQHVACFKMQGDEFQVTLSLLESATAAAMEHQTAQAGSVIHYQQQLRQAQSDRLMRPYRRTEIVQQAKTDQTSRWGSD